MKSSDLLGSLLGLFLVLEGQLGHCNEEVAPLVAVYAVRGQTARLPCNLTSEPEDPVTLVLWYKNGTKKPVFSVDLRVPSSDGEARTWDLLGGRAELQSLDWSWTLMVKKVQYSDQGEYRCRLDFQSYPTHNSRVMLHVVDLPQELRVYSPGGAQVNHVASVQEGHPLTLSCRATGGDPLPNVTWWSGTTVIDDEIEERQVTSTPTATAASIIPTLPYVTNTLHVPTLSRALMSHNLTCRAANTPVLPPLTATVQLIQTDSELRLHMEAPKGKLSVGATSYDVKCQASGVRPPPVLTWWLRGQPITRNVDVKHVDESSTVSVLRLEVTAGDDGAKLECRGVAPTVPHLKDAESATLTVHYVPEASISLTGGAGLQAGDSATFTCEARANPPAYNHTFLFNGRPLRRDSVKMSGWSITLLKLTHRDAGLYTCLASNSEGDGQSNAVLLHIDYAPVCAWEGARRVHAVAGEKVEMECSVRAAPAHVTYQWSSITITNSLEQKESLPLKHKDSGLTSLGWMIAENGTSGEQRAECLPRNSVGTARQPCIFSIVLVEEPSLLINCYTHDVTTDSAAVTCSPATNSANLPHQYHIEVRESTEVVAAYNSSEPSFTLTTLTPGRKYEVIMFASHAKARGPETTLTLKTDTPKAEQVAPERVSTNSNKDGDGGQLQTTEAPEGGAPVSAVVAGVVGVVVGVAIVVAGVVTCRARRGHTATTPSAHQYQHASRDSLLELPPGSVCQSCTTHSSRELLTTFSPGPVVVTQVTSGRSSMRSSPLPRRSSTRSAPGGTSPRGHRMRAPSVRGGPVHVVEVEADNITTPRVEIESPSRGSGRLSLRGAPYTILDSPPLSLRCEPLQQQTVSPQQESQPLGQTLSPEEAQTSHRLQLLPESYVTLPRHPASHSQVSPQLPHGAPIHTQTLSHTSLSQLPHTAPQHDAQAPSQPHTEPHYTQTLPHASSSQAPHIVLHHTQTLPHTTASSQPLHTAVQHHTQPQIHIVSVPLSTPQLEVTTTQAHTHTMAQSSLPVQDVVALQTHTLYQDTTSQPNTESKVEYQLQPQQSQQPQPQQPQQQQTTTLQLSPQLHTSSQPHPPSQPQSEAPVIHQHCSSSPKSGLIKFYSTFR